MSAMVGKFELLTRVKEKTRKVIRNRLSNINREDLDLNTNGMRCAVESCRLFNQNLEA